MTKPNSSSPGGMLPPGKKRKYNPKSLANLPAKKEGAKVVSMRLTESTRQMATIVGGEQGRTAGVERLFALLPTFYRIKLFLEVGLMPAIEQLKEIECTPDVWNEQTKAELIHGIKAALEALAKINQQAEVLANEMSGLEIDRVYEEIIKADRGL